MRKITVISALLLLLLASTACAEKPEPPGQLTVVFEMVVAVEDAIAESNWSEALQVVAEVETILQYAAPKIREAIGDQTVQALDEEIAGTRKAIREKNKAAASDALIMLQKEVFHAMEAFNYYVHPAFIVIQRYVEEALVAAEEKDFERVIHEMKEIATVLATSTDIMLRQGVGKGMQSDFRNELMTVMEAVKDKDMKRSVDALKKMKIISGAFVWMGSQ